MDGRPAQYCAQICSLHFVFREPSRAGAFVPLQDQTPCPAGGLQRSRGRPRRQDGAPPASPSTTRIICATCDFSARPAPAVRFTRAGWYSNGGSPRGRRRGARRRARASTRPARPWRRTSSRCSPRPACTRDHVEEVLLDRDEAVAELAQLVDVADAVGDVHEARARRDHAPASDACRGRGRGRSSRAESPHDCAFAMSSSETSKSAYTFATSSWSSSTSTSFRSFSASSPETDFSDLGRKASCRVPDRDAGLLERVDDGHQRVRRRRHRPVVPIVRVVVRARAHRRIHELVFRGRALLEVDDPLAVEGPRRRSRGSHAARLLEDLPELPPPCGCGCRWCPRSEEGRRRCRCPRR